MTTGELYKLAEKTDTEIIVGHLKHNKGFSVLDDDGDAHIVIRHKYETTAEERVVLAHELGHCMRGAFYNLYSPYEARGKQERQADTWAIERLVPKDEFFAACKGGAHYPYEIAEVFNITSQFAEKVMRYYLCRD